MEQADRRDPDAGLFRRAVLDRRAEPLAGDIHVGVPVSWQLLGALLASIVIVALIFLFAGSYSQVENVPGSIVLDRGVAEVVPTRPGTVTQVRVRDGQDVPAGAPLVQIAVGEVLDDGAGAPEEVLRALDSEGAGVTRQTQHALAAAGAEEARLRAQSAGLRGELSTLGRQLEVQKELVASAAREVEIVRDAATRGFISRRDVLGREETLMVRRQNLAQLEQTVAGKEASLAETQQALAQAQAESGARTAALSSTAAGIAQRRAEANAQRGYLITSPVAGRVTGLVAKQGQAVSGSRPLMLILPRGAQPAVELYVPTKAAGFLKPGQAVRIAVDAFPYQRYGTLAGTVSQMSAAATTRPAADGRADPVYVVSVALDRSSQADFGTRQPLLPGMTLSARIVTDRRTLLEWLFEPLFAVRRR
jgi:membrane fusion protein